MGKEVELPRELRPSCVPSDGGLGDSDSAVELWEPRAQDACSQPKKRSSCPLKEEAGTPQSAGSTLRVGLEAAEPGDLLPSMEVPAEPTGELGDFQGGT